MGCAASVDVHSTSVPRAQFTQVVPAGSLRHHRQNGKSDGKLAWGHHVLGAEGIQDDKNFDEIEQSGIPMDKRPTQECVKNTSSRSIMIIGAPVDFKQDCLVTFNSCDFEPDEDDFAAGIPLPTCAPNDRRHLRRLGRMRQIVQDFPHQLTSLVHMRREVL
ncbi:unnamed protein product [Polarella glacialis]|uniref:Uncharacterized protein n=1 Tax=Polarella glacialis TaxID=89957 RepID=A0A813L8Q6_POLGL|nr:unnamed protein product [Polarella glacialis]